MAVSPSDFYTGMVIEYNGEPYSIEQYQLVNVGRGGAVYRTKLRGVKNPKTIEVTFKPSVTLEEVEKENKKMQYLYNTGDAYAFMDSETFDQIEISEEVIGEKGKFLQEGADFYIASLDGIPFSVQLPPKMDFKVVSTIPGVKGDTAQGGSKPATLENGVVVQVPLFIKEGESIRINTESGDYVERVKA